MRELLPALPQGVAIRIDPGLPSGMIVDPAQAAEMVQQCAVFPGGTSVDLGTLDLPRGVRRVLAEVSVDRPFVEALWFIKYRIADGPAQGLVAYRTGPSSEAQESTVGAVAEALDAGVLGTDFSSHLAGVQIMSVDDLPDEVRCWVEQQPPVTSTA